MDTSPHTVAELVDKIGVSNLAQALGHRNVSTVSSWKTRGSIPVPYWPRIIEVADKTKVGGIDYGSLVAIHAGKRKVA